MVSGIFTLVIWLLLGFITTFCVIGVNYEHERTLNLKGGNGVILFFGTVFGGFTLCFVVFLTIAAIVGYSIYLLLEALMAMLTKMEIKNPFYRGH